MKKGVIASVILIILVIIAMTSQDPELSPGMKRYDVDGNKIVNIDDAVALLLHLRHSQGIDINQELPKIHIGNKWITEEHLIETLRIAAQNAPEDIERYKNQKDSVAFAPSIPITCSGEFIRGDSDGSGANNPQDPINLIDAITSLDFMFGTSPVNVVDCEDRVDYDDSGNLDLLDVLKLLEYFFLVGGTPPHGPYPTPGYDEYAYGNPTLGYQDVACDGIDNDGDGETDEGETCTLPAHCTNGVIDQDETDVDCGGVSCNGCKDSKKCDLNSDCTSGICLNGILCVPPTPPGFGPLCQPIIHNDQYVNPISTIITSDDYDHGTPFNQNDFGYDKYLEDIQVAVSDLFEEEPYKNAEINVYAVTDISYDIQCRHECVENGNTPCSAIDCSDINSPYYDPSSPYNTPGNPLYDPGRCRGLQCSNNAKNILANHCPSIGPNLPNEHDTVLFNSEIFGGVTISVGVGGGPGIYYNIQTSQSYALDAYDHEFSHLFGHLHDEYVDGSGFNPYYSPDLNCEPTPGCPSWSDLQSAGFSDVTCIAGCDRYPIPTLYRSIDNGIMNTHSMNTYGTANERILCCRIGHDTGVVPPYCSIFTDNTDPLNPLDLYSFCQTISQGSIPSPGPSPSLSPLEEQEKLEVESQGKAEYMTNPKRVTIIESEEVYEIQEIRDMPQGLFDKETEVPEHTLEFIITTSEGKRITFHRKETATARTYHWEDPKTGERIPDSEFEVPISKWAFHINTENIERIDIVKINEGISQRLI